MTEVEKELLDYVLEMRERDATALSMQADVDRFRYLRNNLIAERTSPEIIQNASSLLRERIRADRRWCAYLAKVKMADSMQRKIVDAVYAEAEFQAEAEQ